MIRDGEITIMTMSNDVITDAELPPAVAGRVARDDVERVTGIAGRFDGAFVHRPGDRLARRTATRHAGVGRVAGRCALVQLEQDVA